MNTPEKFHRACKNGNLKLAKKYQDCDFNFEAAMYEAERRGHDHIFQFLQYLRSIS